MRGLSQETTWFSQKGKVMAEKRMFTKKITDADEFISLPSSTQALYLHLCMAADDDGFNNQVQMAMFKAHASVDDVKILLTKRFILQFESGVIVIKHWRMANALRKDRYTETAYQEELKRLKVKDNGSYTFADGNDVWLPDGCQMVAERLPQYSIDKDSIDYKEKINQKEKKSTRFIPPTIDEIKAYCDERNSSVDPESFYSFYESKGWMIGKNKMKNWKMAISTWERKDANYVSNREEQKREENDKKKGLVHIDDWTKVDKDGNYHPEW